MNGHENLFFTCIFFLKVTSISAHPAWGIVVDQDRNVYFADIGNRGGAIWKLSNSGELSCLIDHIHAHNLSLDQDGNVITAHGEIPYALIRISKSGRIDTLLQSNDIHTFYGGNTTFFPPDQVIFGIKDKLTQRSYKKGSELKVLGNKEFVWNQTVYVDSNGIVYAPDIGIKNGAIVRIDTNGNSSIIAEDLIARLDRPKDKHNDVLLGITKGCDGNIYVAELAGKRIIKIGDDGLKSDFYKPDGGWFPTAIDFFSGDAYIMEYRQIGSKVEGPRIVKIDETGRLSTLFTYGQAAEAQIQHVDHSIKQEVGKSLEARYILLGLLLIGLILYEIKRNLQN